MQKTIRISVGEGYSLNTLLTASYVNKDNDTVSLTSREELVKNKMPEGSVKFRFTFSPTNRTLERTFNLPDGKKLSDDASEAIRQSKDQSIYNFWVNNPQIKNIDNLKKGQKSDSQYVMTVVEDVEEISFNRLNEQIVIANIISNMDVNERRDISYWFGHDLKKLTNHGVFVALCDFENGIAMLDSNAKQLIERDGKQTSLDVKVTVMVRKAVSLGILEVRLDKHYYSTVNNTMVGMTELDVVDGYVKNADTYKFMLAAVQKQEHKLNITAPAQDEEMTKGEIFRIRQRAKKLNIDDNATMDIYLLKQMVDKKDSEVTA